MSDLKIYIDGQFYAKEDAKISVFDHGLLYGDGIFEGIRLYKKCVFKLDEHLERLEYSAKAILLKLPWSRGEIAEAVCETCRVNNLENAYIRLVVTRGVGTLGLSPTTCPRPSLIVMTSGSDFYPEHFYTEGIKLITVPTRRTSMGALPPLVKSLNYLNNIMGKIECKHVGYDEALMLNEAGMVAECTGDNVFIIHKDTLITPPAEAAILMGITRKTVLEMAEALGLSVQEAPISRYAIWNADEFFITGTAAEIIPVYELDGRTIGNGKPGPWTKRLQEQYFKINSQVGTCL